jgi:hypothetical protein
MAILVWGSFNVAGVWDAALEVWKCRGSAGVVLPGWGSRETVPCIFGKRFQKICCDPPGSSRFFYFATGPNFE